MTRGIKHDIDRMINDLQAQYFPYEYHKQKMLVQLAIRPIQLWEVVLPAPCMPELMRTLWDSQDNVDTRPAFGMGLKMIRKTLGVQPMPKLDPKIFPRPIYKMNCCVYGIGIKDDVIQEDGTENL